MLSKNQVKYLHSLRMGKFRDANRVFIAEGTKLVEDLIDSHFNIRVIYGTPAWTDKHQRMIAGHEYAVEEITPEELKMISSLVTPNEVLAVVGYRDVPEPSTDALGNIILVLDRIQDPGNFGTIIRTADWFGIRHIFCSPDTVDVYNPKVVQATMGSICRVTVHYIELKKLATVLGQSWHIYGTIAGGENIYSAELLYPAAIMIGNESKGISEMNFDMINYRIGIPPGAEGAESLNASVAAGIVMSEFCRRSEVRGQQSAVSSQQSAVGGRQSAVGGRRSTVRSKKL